MRPVIRWAVLLTVLALVLPAIAADEKKKSDSKSDAKDTKEPKEKLVALGKPIVGKLIHVEGTSKYFTVQVTHKIQVVNSDHARSLFNWKQELAKAQANNDSNRAQTCLNYILHHQQRLYGSQDKHQKYELQAAEDMKVRVLAPPVAFDDKGNKKKYTLKELKELKGDSKLPGFAGEFEDLRPNQIVEVHLGQKQRTVLKASEKEKEKDDLPNNRPQVMTIVILSEPPK